MRSLGQKLKINDISPGPKILNALDQQVHRRCSVAGRGSSTGFAVAQKARNVTNLGLSRCLHACRKVGTLFGSLLGIPLLHKSYED